MPHFGTLCLHLSLLATALATPLFFRAANEDGRGLRAARLLATAAAAFASTALSLMALAALTHDLRIEYIASYTDRTTSPIYLLSSIWAGQAGSLTVWAVILAWLTVGLSAHLRRDEPELEPAAMGFMLLLQGFFLVVLVGWSNPFMLIDGSEQLDGNGLNPLLRNLLMIFHPPALLAGYAAYAPPAAITAAALLVGRFDRGCLDALRHWSILAWALLTLGNALGMVWAYGELGWGGYWGWDPVENASLIPWLTGTALLHQLLAERRHKAALGWSAVLALLTFWLTLFGTYLTRSGIVASVHAFGHTPIADAFAVLLAVVALASLTGLLMRRRMLAWPSWTSWSVAGRAAVGLAVLALGLELPGLLRLVAAPAILALIVGWSALRPRAEGDRFVPQLVGYLITAALAGVLEPALWPACGLLAAALLILGWWRGVLESEGSASIAARPILLARTVMLLTALAAGVLFGTLMPLTSQTFTGDQVQVDASWYAGWAAPAGLVLLGMTGLCLLLGGAKISVRPKRQLPAVAAAVVALAAAWLMGVSSPLALVALALAGMTGWTALQRGAAVIASARSKAPRSGRGRTLPSKMGAVLAHLGLAILFLGLSGEADKQERNLELIRGEDVPLGQWRFRLEGVTPRLELELEALGAEITVTNGSATKRLRPERRRYRTHPDQPTSEAAVWSDLAGDLFLTLGQVSGEGEDERVWVRAVSTPRLAWIWIGCALMTLAGLLTVVAASRPRLQTLVILGAATVTTTALWFAVRPSSALAALSAFTLVLALWWLGQSLLPPLLGLAPASTDDETDETSDQSHDDEGGANDQAPSCPECGVDLVRGSRFCHKCGAEVERDT